MIGAFIVLRGAFTRRLTFGRLSPYHTIYDTKQACVSLSTIMYRRGSLTDGSAEYGYGSGAGEDGRYVDGTVGRNG